jgi:hypothetical protein
MKVSSIGGEHQAGIQYSYNEVSVVLKCFIVLKLQCQYCQINLILKRKERLLLLRIAVVIS